jgi:hypothetical protein
MTSYLDAPQMGISYINTSGTYKYKIGVIDFLTEYNTTKKVQTAFKKMLHWRERDKLSC